MQYAPPHCRQNRQNKFERGARAACKNRNIAGVRTMAAARNRAFHEHRATRLNQSAEPDDFAIIGCAHFEPNLARAHDLKKAVRALGHGSAGRGRWQAGDD